MRPALQGSPGSPAAGTTAPPGPRSWRISIAQIDSLEKTKIEVRQYQRYQELFALFLCRPWSLVLVEVLLAGTRLRTLP